MLQTDSMGSNHLERQGEGEGTAIKFVIVEELRGGEAVLIRQTEHKQFQDTL